LEYLSGKRKLNRIDVGDIIQIGNDYYIVDTVGVKK
jgi:hypothetical protein